MVSDESESTDLKPPPWLLIAADEIGIKEIMGVKHHPKILRYHQATSLKATTDEIAWCSAFTNWCMKKTGVYEGTDSALARSWLKWGEGVLEPYKGCIVVLERGQPWQGHVGFFAGWHSPAFIKILGGNQKNAVCIRNYPLAHVLAYRQPVGYSR